MAFKKFLTKIIKKFMPVNPRQDFVKRYSTVVSNLVKGTGIFPETMFAQAIVESQKGNEMPGSELAKTYHNLFGIKDSKSWTGKVVDMKTKEVYNGIENSITDGFRVYNSIEDSFADYVKFLLGNPRYKSAGVFSSATVKEQAQKLQNAGYATDPNYATLISSVASSISKYITPTSVGVGVAVLVLLFGSVYYFSK